MSDAPQKRWFQFSLKALLLVITMLAVGSGMMRLGYDQGFKEAVRQFTVASLPSLNDDQKSAASFNLNILRAQIQMYRTQHDGLYPSATLLKRTSNTNRAGTVGTGNHYPLGPYLLNLPENPYSGSSAVTSISNSPSQAADVTGNGGWLYNAKTGEVWIDDATLYIE